MKYTLLLLAFLLSAISFAQDKYYTKSGTITFESSVPSFEEVKATNNKVTAILKSDGTIASLALTKGFRFKIALMEEHFNENYIESNTFPKATFSGKIIDFNTNNLSSTDKIFKIKGTLLIRGIKKEVTIDSKIKIVGNSIYLSADFSVTPEDFNIKIPNIVRKKIAKKVDVSFHFELKKK
ncbi:YceI family protein [Polaribacter gochangensis]|uniref:YceI family protein n=1 Tax=Polaribacter gochangensis TaxID=3252903 RepID=UPI003904A78B